MPTLTARSEAELWVRSLRTSIAGLERVAVLVIDHEPTSASRSLVEHRNGVWPVVDHLDLDPTTG